MNAWVARQWARLPVGLRAWLTDAAERVGASFAQAVIAAVGAGALAKGLSVPAVDALLIAGFTAALATGKALVAAFVSSRGASPAGLGLKTRAPSIATSGRLDLLPPPSGRKGGRLAKPRDDRDWTAQLPAKIPASADYGKGFTFGMLLNDRLGDCAPAALLHALQVLSAGKYVPTDAQVLDVYEKVAGYRPGQPSTDRGTVVRDMLRWAVRQGYIEAFAAVPLDPQSLRRAVAGHKAVICGWALPDGAETEGDHWTVPRTGRQAGSWGGHATCADGYTRSRLDNVTWGEEGTVTDGFVRDYLEEAWVLTPGPKLPA